jgi:hypothetical protein
MEATGLDFLSKGTNDSSSHTLVQLEITSRVEVYPINIILRVRAAQTFDVCKSNVRGGIDQTAQRMVDKNNPVVIVNERLCEALVNLANNYPEIWQGRLSIVS